MADVDQTMDFCTAHSLNIPTFRRDVLLACSGWMNWFKWMLKWYSGTKYKHFWILEPWRWDRQVVPKRRQEIANTRCVTSQKSAVLIQFAAEAWSHALCKHTINWTTEGQCHSIKHVQQLATDETAWLSQQQSAQQKDGGEADSPAAWSLTDSSEPVTKGRNNCGTAHKTRLTDPWRRRQDAPSKRPYRDTASYTAETDQCRMLLRWLYHRVIRRDGDGIAVSARRRGGPCLH